MSRALAAFLAVAISDGNAAAADIWHPTGQMQWQWVLQTPVDTSVKVPVFDIDGFDNDASVVATLHANGAKVICYISAGTYENWRPDASSFPSSVLGSSNGWHGERWLDIRQISILGPIMLARMEMCASKGFDAIEPDNIDGYTNNTGFPLTAPDQMQYNIWVATAAHSVGLSIGLKNDPDQASGLQPYFDWMLDEQCFQYSECSSLTSFVSAGKTVFETEYQGTPSSICPQANSMGLSTIFKSLNLLNTPLTECVTASASQAPVITSPLASSGTVGAAYSYQIAATNGPTSFNATGLPTGITANTATGLISGTPLSDGTFSVTLTATNGGGIGTATLVLQVSSPVSPLGTITASPLPSGVVGGAYSQAIAVTGGTAPYTWSIVAGALPSGLLLNSATGVMSGTPASAGSFTFTVQVKDSAATTASQSYALSVNALPLSSTYYFPHLAFGGGFQTTLTYVNYAPQNVSCQTTFLSDSGNPLTVPLSGGAVSSRTDNLQPGASIHVQTQAAGNGSLVEGWAEAQCTGTIKASVLYRFYSQGAALGEASVNAMTGPATEFVTFAETHTGVAWANPSTAPAMITITALDGATGLSLRSTTLQLAPHEHGAAIVGPLLNLSSFTGSVQITATTPIVSLSLNAEAFPVFSSLPPGDLPNGTPLATGR